MTSLELILDRAQSLTDEEKYEEAYNVLLAAYPQGKDNAEFLEKIALSAQMLEKKDDAVKYWEELIKIQPSSIVAYDNLQDAYYDTNRYKYYLTRAKIKTLNNQVAQAIPDYKKAIDNTKDEQEKTDTCILMAKAYEFIGKTMNAIDEYYKIAHTSKDSSIHIKIADLYLKENDKYSAISSLEQALEHFPEDKTAKDLIAKLYVETGETEKALKYVVSELLLIKIKLMQGNNDEAFKLLENISDKNNGEYYKLLAEYYFNKKEWDNCCKAIDKFSEYESAHPLTYQMLSLVCEEKGDRFNAHVNRAKMYILKGQDDIALHEYMQAHYMDGKNVDTIQAIISLCENQGEKHTMAEFYEKLLRIEPKNVNALLKLGDFYFDMGEIQQASSFFEKAAEISKKPEVYLKAAKCFEKLKREKIAKDYYEKYVAKAPHSAELALIKARLEQFSDVNENSSEDEGFLEKLFKFFSKK